MTLYPPGPKGRFFIGHAVEFGGDPLGFLMELTRYGDITRTFLGPAPVYTLHHPDLVHQVMVEDAVLYYKPKLGKRVFYPSLGNGLLFNDGDFWRQQRKLTQPAFHHKRVEAYGDVMVSLTHKLLDTWRNGAERDLLHDMTQLTLRIISKTMFDAEVDADGDAVGAAINDGQNIAWKQLSRPVQIPAWLPTAENRAAAKAIAQIDKVVVGFINDRRATGEDKGDLLSMLLLAQDEDTGGRMTDKQVRDEAVTLFAAGHETTANALAWAWYLLSQHPEVEAKLHAEVDSVLGGRPATVADLPRLTYTDMVMKETLRLYPSAWAVTREPVQDVTLAGYAVKAGVLVFISPYSLGRDPRWWTDADQFKPERFSKDNEKNFNKRAYIPFGGGPRVCIGNQFAMMESRLILATVAQHYRLALQPGWKVTPEPLVTLRPKGGLPMHLTLRERVTA